MSDGSETPELVVEEEIEPEEIVTNYLKNKSADRDTSFWHTKIGRYHASDTGRCTRKVYYKHTLGKRMEEDLYGIFKLGRTIEDIIEEALVDHYGKRKVKNSKFVKLDLDGFVIVGETDPVVEGVNSEVEKLYEVKSTNNIKYRKETPSEHHVMQIHPYMKALGLNEATIIYVNKSDLKVVSHMVPFEEDAYKLGIDRISNLHTCLKNDRMPKAEPFQDWECKFCPYDECDRNENEGV